MRSKILSLLVLVLMLLPSLAHGQSTKNIFSTYSMYGLGILETQGTIISRSMGGAGLASRSRSSINILNPASYSIALQKGILLDFGLEGSMYSSSQRVDGEMLSSSNFTANFHDIALQIPVAKNLGFGFSITPFSSAGYQVENAFLTDAGDYIQYQYEGSGNVSLVKAGLGYQIRKGLSVGIAAQYYWGDLDREFSAVVTNIISPGSSISPTGVDNVSISRMKAQVGVQWAAVIRDKSALTLGATFDLGGDLSPRYARVVTGTDGYNSVYAQSDTTNISVVLPRQLAIGATYNREKVTMSMDYTYQNWVSGNEDVEYSMSGMSVVYNNVHQLRFGLEYIPRRMDVRRYMNRVSYRAGARYGGYQYTFQGEKIGQYAVTGGLGFPINMIGISHIDMGLEWGCLGTNKSVIVDNEALGLIKQNSFKFSIGVTLFGDDYWFQRPQID